jgi:hypothetical protein
MRRQAMWVQIGLVGAVAVVFVVRVTRFLRHR